MPVKQIKSERLISLEDLDRQLVNRQSAAKTPVRLENIGNGLAQGDVIEIEQRPDYKGRNVEKNAG